MVDDNREIQYAMPPTGVQVPLSFSLLRNGQVAHRHGHHLLQNGPVVCELELQLLDGALLWVELLLFQMLNLC